MNPAELGPRMTAGFGAMAPRIAMQRLVYWGVIIMAGLVIGLTALYGNLISSRIHAELDHIFSERVWARPLASVDGLRVVVRGEIEPGYRFDREIAAIETMPLVRAVDVDLETIPKPPASARLNRTDDGILELSGAMRGVDADRFSRAVSRAFPRTRVRDRITIDDRVGRPLWLDGIDPALAALAPLENVRWFGWQDAVLVQGIAPDRETRDAVRYSFSASLADNLEISQQIRLAQPPGSPDISLVAGWNGAAISGSVGSEKQVALLGDALRKVAANRSDELGNVVSVQGGSDPTVAVGLTASPDVERTALPFAIAGLLPVLSAVHDLRITTSGPGLAVWGRLDNSVALGEVEAFLDTLPEDLYVENYLVVDSADRKPELSLFRDSQRLIISGRLPAQGIKNELLGALRDTAQISEIEEFISIEPNVAFSPWIERWLSLMPALPKSVFGLTVAADSVLISGEVADAAERQFVTDALASMFPGMQTIDWMTVAGE